MLLKVEPFTYMIRMNPEKVKNPVVLSIAGLKIGMSLNLIHEFGERVFLPHMPAGTRLPFRTSPFRSSRTTPFSTPPGFSTWILTGPESRSKRKPP
jgi:hypothetical protein